MTNREKLVHHLLTHEDFEIYGFNRVDVLKNYSVVIGDDYSMVISDTDEHYLMRNSALVSL